MFLPFFSADLPLPSLDFVDTCDGNNCFSVVDSYSSSSTNGFTVYDTTAPGYTAADAVHQTSSLNQTYGWGCESGDSYGSGTSFDSGVGTNQSDQDIYPYNAVAEKTSMLSSSYTDSAGNTYTGNNGFTVTDSYSCGSGSCGGFTISDVYGSSSTAGSSAVQQLHEVNNNNTSMLSCTEFQHCTSTDAAGNTYTGDNGYTVTDSYSCGSGSCGGFTVSDVYGSSSASSAVQQLHE
eukprot:763993-Hanusia_phi.AAC.1